MLYNKLIKLFLRVALSLGFISTVLDRCGFYTKEVSTWGNWESFLVFTKILNPWFPDTLIPLVGIVVTVLEVLFALCLLVGFKTELFAKFSAVLIFLFALAMTFSIGVKSSFDYSVFTAAAAAFALSFMKEKFLEIDIVFFNLKTNKNK